MVEVQRNPDVTQKQSKVTVLRGRVKKILDYILSLVRPAKLPDIVILPKSVRLAITHNNSVVSKEEILALLDPKYGFLGIWLVLKFYEDDKKVFFEIIGQIMSSFSEEKITPLIYDNLRDKLNQDTKDKQIKTSGKISFISRMGFREFCEALGGLYDDIKGFDSVILVANSGLLGIENILQKLKQTKQELIILFPKFESENMFYSVSFKGGHLSLKFLQGNEIENKFRKKRILIIDDVSSTGKTERQVSQILEDFQPQKTEFRTLIKFPQKREPVAN